MRNHYLMLIVLVCLLISCVADVRKPSYASENNLRYIYRENIYPSIINLLDKIQRDLKSMEPIRLEFENPSNSQPLQKTFTMDSTEIIQVKNFAISRTDTLIKILQRFKKRLKKSK